MNKAQSDELKELEAKLVRLTEAHQAVFSASSDNPHGWYSHLTDLSKKMAELREKIALIRYRDAMGEDQ